MDLKNKTVMVVGTGISGIGAVDLLNKVGADCILYDGNEKLDRQKVQEKLGDNKAEIIIGAFDEALLSKIDLLVISPGVPIDSPIVLTFKNAGIPVWARLSLHIIMIRVRLLQLQELTERQQLQRLLDR